MELALTLGDASTAFKFIDEVIKPPPNSKDFGSCMALACSSISQTETLFWRASVDPPLQLDLQLDLQLARVSVDFNRSSGEEGEDVAAGDSSPNSAASSLLLCGKRSKRDLEAERSDEEDNGLTRKKLRLSKEQSAFLEESFKEHNTLNPKQKLCLAKQLNLRPRQVEVWFQNRRARTKLKQTEVDCEYLKRCCDTLTDENRRLQKEVQQLRALKTSPPNYMQLPATTLTMCPSCERVATTNPNLSISASPTTTTATPVASAGGVSSKSKLFPFP